MCVTLSIFPKCDFLQFAAWKMRSSFKWSQRSRTATTTATVATTSQVTIFLWRGEQVWVELLSRREWKERKRRRHQRLPGILYWCAKLGMCEILDCGTRYIYFFCRHSWQTRLNCCWHYLLQTTRTSSTTAWKPCRPTSNARTAPTSNRPHPQWHCSNSSSWGFSINLSLKKIYDYW